MWSAFHRAIFTIAMTLVKLSIVADRLWEVLSSRIAADDLGILFQEGIHHFDQLASNAHDHSGLPAIRLPFLIVDALSRNESCVELGPLQVGFEISSFLKVQDVANGRNEGGTLDHPDPHRQKNLPFAAVSHHAAN